jgi:hypothetical protein
MLMHSVSLEVRLIFLYADEDGWFKTVALDCRVGLLRKEKKMLGFLSEPRELTPMQVSLRHCIILVEAFDCAEKTNASESPHSSIMTKISKTTSLFKFAESLGKVIEVEQCTG